MLDHLATVEGPTETTSYAYDALERLGERQDGEVTQVFHYGDLSDLPTYMTNGEGKVGTSYVSGPRGLIEQRSAEATAYPLADAHGDITAISGPSGGVESRQEYGPWGEQLSGPSLEMGYLGAWERPTDAATGLMQMGARTYDPSLGSFASEDPIYGYLGFGASFDRYLYAWDDPVNKFDLTGRFPSIGVPGTPIEIHIPIPTPGNPIPEFPVSIKGLPTPSHWLNSHIPDPSFEKSSDKYISDRASDFVKAAKNSLSHLDPFGHGGCERKYIASTDPYFDPCASLFEEAGSPDERAEPPTFVPGFDPPGGVPGMTVQFQLQSELPFQSHRSYPETCLCQ